MQKIHSKYCSADTQYGCATDTQYGCATDAVRMQLRHIADTVRNHCKKGAERLPFSEIEVQWQATGNGSVGSSYYGQRGLGGRPAQTQ